MQEKAIKRLIVIEGPTASGKTALSIALAKHFSTVILSADSRQFYQELWIGTAKPSLEERDGIVHYFIDSHSIQEEFTAAQFEKAANEVLTTEFQQHDNIILVGGSGMFIDALCNGLDEIPANKELREALTLELEEKGLEILLEELKERDPEFYTQVDQKNPVRVLRAIEVIRLTGKTFTEMRKASKKEHPFEIVRFIIEHDREKLYERINLRVDLMMQQGLLAEVQNVYEFKHLNALRTVGYSELFDFLDGKTTLDEAVELIKQNSRRYAKRQLTWFRKHTDAHMIPFDTQDKMLLRVVNELTKI